MPAKRRPAPTDPDTGEPGRRKPGERDQLLRPDWRYVETFNMDDFRRDDWAVLNNQRDEYLRTELPRQVLGMLKASAHAPTFGYAINNFEHCLQTALLLYQDDYDEETIVAGLLHDLGFIVCPHDHGSFAASLLRPFLSEKNLWMLEHHEIFQRIHLHEYQESEDHEFVNARERWRGHPYFDWTAKFVERYDIVAINPEIESPPLEFFEPMVYRVLSHAQQQRGQ
ncbi:MAG: HD domain-containing protein [Gammaproteobacteria bacterium]|nr:HD domain-containing protein [Gammaproteobacteria bacterium]MDH3507728.1 HD domain-containing protein [Gammaproteobacteria bacterium]